MITQALSFALICILATVPEVQAQATTELEERMDEMNAAYRKIGRQLADASKNADTLKLIRVFREHAMAAGKLEPKKKAEIPAADRARFVADYQAGVKALLGKLTQLEDAVKAGKNDEAATVLKALKQGQEAGHREFRKAKESFESKAARAAKANEK